MASSQIQGPRPLTPAINDLAIIANALLTTRKLKFITKRPGTDPSTSNKIYVKINRKRYCLTDILNARPSLESVHLTQLSIESAKALFKDDVSNGFNHFKANKLNKLKGELEKDGIAITDAYMIAINLYTQEDYYRDMNGLLRFPSGTYPIGNKAGTVKKMSSPEIKRSLLLSILTAKGLAQLPPEEITTHRSENTKRDLDDLTTALAFTSTSKRRQFGFGSHQISYAGSGSNISYLSHYTEEGEVLIKPMAHYRVTQTALSRLIGNSRVVKTVLSPFVGGPSCEQFDSPYIDDTDRGSYARMQLADKMKERIALYKRKLKIYACFTPLIVTIPFFLRFKKKLDQKTKVLRLAENMSTGYEKGDQSLSKLLALDTRLLARHRDEEKCKTRSLANEAKTLYIQRHFDGQVIPLVVKIDKEIHSTERERPSSWTTAMFQQEEQTNAQNKIKVLFCAKLELLIKAGPSAAVDAVAAAAAVDAVDAAAAVDAIVKQNVPLIQEILRNQKARATQPTDSVAIFATQGIFYGMTRPNLQRLEDAKKTHTKWEDSSSKKLVAEVESLLEIPI